MDTAYRVTGDETAWAINQMANRWGDIVWDVFGKSAPAEHVNRAVTAWTLLGFIREKATSEFGEDWPQPTADAVALAAVARDNPDDVTAALVLADALTDSGGEWEVLATQIREVAPYIVEILGREKPKKKGRPRKSGK